MSETDYSFLDKKPFISPEGFLQLLLRYTPARYEFLEGMNWISDEYYNLNIKEH